MAKAKARLPTGFARPPKTKAAVFNRLDRLMGGKKRGAKARPGKARKGGGGGGG
jgi:hypothetical protein